MHNFCADCLFETNSLEACPKCGSMRKRTPFVLNFSTQIQALSAINYPLALEPMHSIPPAKNADCESVLKAVVKAPSPFETKPFQKRYAEITRAEKNLLGFAPNDPIILERIIEPLRHAKASYVCGNLIGCIALCGMVSEMLSVMMFDVCITQLTGKPLTKKSKVILKDVQDFEEEKASDRLKCLHEYGVINRKTFDALNHVRDKRNNYLHVYSNSYDRIEEESRKVYEKVVFAVHSILAQDLRDDGVHLAKEIRDWLARPR